MQWKHMVSLDWLIDRQNYLTATDVRSLVPVTKTGRPRKIDEMDYLRVFSNKLVNLTEENCWSYDAAARGHLLEPYAIEAFNALGVGELFHWDDKILSSKGPGFLSFSPDALDVPMTAEDAVESARVLGEVKSYGAERHLVTAQVPLKELEERWQVATAMAVAPNIDDAYLILYNPNIMVKQSQLYVIEMTRSDLEDEIEMILEVEDKWHKFTLSDPLSVSVGRFRGSSVSSMNKIISDIEEAQRLNP